MPVSTYASVAPETATRVALETHGTQLGLAGAEGDAGTCSTECAGGGGHCGCTVSFGAAQGSHGRAMRGPWKYGELLGVDSLYCWSPDPYDEQLRISHSIAMAWRALQPQP
ncbi:unnamed protein product [Phytophthora lilii]|uniref:Unnamed protein product n=1 Tax=Phytophthora lilii TaxID=2077276 RepID=A0A9W6TPC1_9STRA|nr:unnamed protein product [Phytophthora lilii]